MIFFFQLKMYSSIKKYHKSRSVFHGVARNNSFFKTFDQNLIF